MHNFTKTTFLTLAGSALLVSVASAQPWQDQSNQATTTRTVTTYTTTTNHDAPPPPPGGYGPPPGEGPGGQYAPPPQGQLGPRVGQVDQRISQLNWRVGHMVHHGAINPHQGDWFHQQILNVQQQEQTYTTRGYGHLNDWQQRQLNMKLDRISQKLDHYGA